MDGIEVIVSMRNSDAGEVGKTIPIIAATAYAMVGDREKFLKAGLDGYVVKPIELEKLQEVLNEIADNAAEERLPPSKVHLLQ